MPDTLLASIGHWIAIALVIVGGVAVILRGLVQLGLPLQSSVKFVDVLLKILNGVAMNPNANLARTPAPKKNPVVGTELKGKLLVLLLLAGVTASSSSCAWFQKNGATATVDCATTEIADAIISKVQGGATNAANWQEQLGAYLASTVDCVLRKWLASRVGLAGSTPQELEGVRRAQLWLETHPQSKS